MEGLAFLIMGILLGGSVCLIGGVLLGILVCKWFFLMAVIGAYFLTMLFASRFPDKIRDFIHDKGWMVALVIELILIVLFIII